METRNLLEYIKKISQPNIVNFLNDSSSFYYLHIDNWYFKIDNLPENLYSLRIINEHECVEYFISDDFINLPEKLIILWCECCKITNLDNLPNNLKELHCNVNKLISLNNLPINLKKLHSNNNKLTCLDYLPESLEILDCSYNLITELNNLPRGLKYLECSGNQIINLDSLPDGLEQIFCKLNNIEVIYRLPSSLTIGNFTDNPLIYRPKCSNSLVLLNYSLNTKKASTFAKLFIIWDKFSYNSYISDNTYRPNKYSAYGFGISLAVIIACPVYLAYSKFKK